MKVFGYLWGVFRRLLFALYVMVRCVLWFVAAFLYFWVFLFIVAFCWLLAIIDYILTGTDRCPSHYINGALVFGESWMTFTRDFIVVRRFLRLQ